MTRRHRDKGKISFQIQTGESGKHKDESAAWKRKEDEWKERGERMNGRRRVKWSVMTGGLKNGQQRKKCSIWLCAEMNRRREKMEWVGRNVGKKETPIDNEWTGSFRQEGWTISGQIMGGIKERLFELCNVQPDELVWIVLWIHSVLKNLSFFAFATIL